MIIQVSLNEDDFNQVQNKAREKHLSMSSMARTLIIEGLNHERN